MLRPGGTLIVSDGNNARNAKIRKYTEQMWSDHESDPRSTPSGKTFADDPWQLVEHRRRIVRGGSSRRSIATTPGASR